MTDRHPFVARLEAEAEAVAAFVDVLRREQQALVAGDAEALPLLAEDKGTHVARLAELSEFRSRQLADLGLSPDRAGMDLFAERVPEARPAWARLRSLAGEARDMNETNGTIIRARLNHFQKAMRFLKSAATGADLYGRDGQALAIGSGRCLGAV